jgi:hypothetical protein
MKASSMLLAAALFGAANAQEMTPEHTKTLTPDNFNDWIKGEVDAGRTAFVRWIASEG